MTKKIDLDKLQTLNKDIIGFQNQSDKKGNEIFRLKNERITLGNNISVAESQIRKILGYDKRTKSMKDKIDEKMRV